MKKLGLFLFIMTLFVGLLIGCSQNTNNPNNESSSNNGTEETAGNDTNETENSTDGGQWPHTITDAMGREIVLEKKPEKTALLFFRNYEHMFLLEEFPIAASDLNVLDDWASLTPYQGQYTITDVGSMTEPNVEKLLEIQPDVILMFAGWHEKYGEKVEKIAPVITVDSNENNWQGALRVYGEIFGKEEKAETEIERIEKLIQDSKEQLASYKDKTFGVIMLGEKQFWAFTTQFIFNGDNGLGLNPPENYVDLSSKGEEISLEGLVAMDLDYIFVADINGSPETRDAYLKELEQDSAWNAMKAVKNGHVYPLDSSIAAGGPLGIELGVKTIINSLKE